MMIMSEYKNVSNYKKTRGITTLIKKKIVDDNIMILNILTALNETVYIAAIYWASGTPLSMPTMTS